MCVCAWAGGGGGGGATLLFFSVGGGGGGRGVSCSETINKINNIFRIFHDGTFRTVAAPTKLGTCVYSSFRESRIFCFGTYGT